MSLRRFFLVEFEVCTLGGENVRRWKTKPKPGAVPLIFSWKRSSPRKRLPPSPRPAPLTLSKNLEKDSGGVMCKGNEGCSSISEDKSDEPAVTMVNSQFLERAEMEPSSEPADFAEKSDKDSLILELKEGLSALLLKNEKLEEVLNLKEKMRDLQGQHEKLEERLFSLKNVATNDSLINFYTGFLNLALYEFLNPGAGGESETRKT